MRYRPEIDGLRALAVVPVILFHAGLDAFSGGFVGVDVFFVISGYLITSLMVEERRGGSLSIVKFYERRARRILPALVAMVLATTIAALAWYTPPELEDYSKSLAAVAAFVSNFYFASGTGYFETGSLFKPLLHTWSLAVEEQYYLFAPPIFLLLWRFGMRTLVATTALVAIGSFLCALKFGADEPLVNFFFTPSRVWELMLGALAAFAMPRLVATPMHPVVIELLAALGAGMILLAIFTLDETDPIPGIHSLLPTVGALLVILFADRSNWVGRVLSLRPIVAIGLVSYSAYLWHWPLIAFTELHVGANTGIVVSLSLVAATFVLAALSWRYIEQPFRDRSFIPRRRLFQMTATAIAVMAAGGGAVALTHGLPGRYGEPERSYFAAFNALSDLRWQCSLQRLAAFDSDAPCVIGADGAKPSIAFWGDSHAEAIASGAGAELAGRGRSARIYALGLCPALPGRMSARGEHYDQRCADRNRAVFAQIAGDPAVTHVVLAGWWQYYEKWGGLVPDRSLPNAARCVDSTAGDHSDFAQALLLIVCELQSSGKTVTIVRQVPTTSPGLIASVFDRARNRIGSSDLSFASPRADYAAQPGNQLFDRIASANVGVFDTYAHLCDTEAETCPLIAGGLPIYRDVNHVTTVGSAKLAPALVDLIAR